MNLLCRIEAEIEDLENQELNISRNEVLILQQLKEVERTAEDIIKVPLLSLRTGTHRVRRVKVIRTRNVRSAIMQRCHRRKRLLISTPCISTQEVNGDFTTGKRNLYAA